MRQGYLRALIAVRTRLIAACSTEVSVEESCASGSNKGDSAGRAVPLAKSAGAKSGNEGGGFGMAMGSRGCASLVHRGVVDLVVEAGLR